MANKTGKKGKKPLQTSLGKASCLNETDVDLSHVRKPINTSVFGLRQVLSLFQTATQEVQNYITYECDIMYECRTCRTIFRSLANFILHKRDYCRERFNHLDGLNNNEEIQENVCESTTCGTSSTNDIEHSTEINAVADPKKGLSPVIDRLKQKQQISQLAEEILHQDLSSNDVAEERNESCVRSKGNDVLLEEIATNNAAVFQTVLQNIPKRSRNVRKPEFMKSEVMEIHGILENDEAVLGPDGKICNFETNKLNKNPAIPKNDLFCTQCKLQFSTKKTLTYHIKYKHNNTRLVYVCPDCKDTFANAWCVYRHLYKIHRRTSAQIRRMREQIHNSCVRRDQEPTKKKDKKNDDKVDKTDEENQWLNNIEGDNDFQMCGGCGKRFERKAALHSHAQMCTKRIAVCNTIKENNAKKKEEEDKELRNKNTKADKVDAPKGSSKRKSYLLRTYKPLQDDVERPVEDKNDCDVNANCEIVENNCDNQVGVTEEDAVRISSSLEDLPSSQTKDFIASPSIEKIDTEKMLNIIGISTNYEYSSENKKTPEKTTEKEENSNKEEGISKDNRSHTALDFDLFCQSVTESLLKDSEGDIEEYNQKSNKTVPLIIRRKTNSSRCKKRNSILEQNNETASKIEEINKSEMKTDKKDSMKNQNVIETNETVETDSLATSSSFKISVKRLEDLIGISPRSHVGASESNETDQTAVEETQTSNDALNHSSNIGAASNFLTNNLKVNIFRENLDLKCSKRKRTSSFDSRESNKLSKMFKRSFFANKQNISFISKASPFMDQRNLVCIPCGLKYPTLSKLLWHMSAHFSWFRFQCSRCSFISFNKMDCANHARKSHFVKKSSIPSVVLPIPNWKTVLMSHEFCMLIDENDLSGKHTDEVLYENPEEMIVLDNSDERIDEFSDTDWKNILFTESKHADSEPENDPLKCDPVSIKQECIDVVDDDQESFQLEVPQEIYTWNMSEIIESANVEQRFHFETQNKTKKVEESDELTNMFVSTDQENELFFNEINIGPEHHTEINEEMFFSPIISSEEARDTKINEDVFNEVNVLANDTEDKSCTDKSINIRPTRNRMRSIKTSQDDFFYDLSKVIKLNGSSNKSNLKHRKAVSTVSQKNGKDSAADTKSGNQQIRVYSKKK